MAVYGGNLSGVEQTLLSQGYQEERGSDSFETTFNYGQAGKVRKTWFDFKVVNAGSRGRPRYRLWVKPYPYGGFGHLF